MLQAGHLPDRGFSMGLKGIVGVIQMLLVLASVSKELVTAEASADTHRGEAMTGGSKMSMQDVG